METITHILEIRRDDSKRVKNVFLYDKQETTLNTTMATFTKSEKKEAKLNYKISLQSTMHQDKRKTLVEHLVKQSFPNWNIKVGFLKNNK